MFRVKRASISCGLYVVTGKTLKEKDAIIDLVCDLCRLHQQSGFIAALSRINK